jgi:energy-coupling factor transporter ATP-binding protein EcfA2
MKALLKIKNYRCFSDDSPLEVPIGDDPVAFVGANNSGKSAAIRLLHELQPLWQQLLASTGNWAGGAFALGGLRDVPDALEVFHDGNNRNIEVELTLRETSDVPLARGQVQRVATVWDRQSQNVTVATTLLDGSTLTSLRGGDPQNRRLLDSDKQGIEAGWIFDTLNRLARAQYVPPHRNVLLSGGAESYGISIGANFINRWNTFKVGGSKRQTLAALETEQLIASIFGFRLLQINAMPNNDLQVVIDGKPYRINEVGHGIAQFVVTLVNLLFLKPPIVCLDEPETGLHPALQIKYLSHVAKVTQGAVFFATHSIGLARSFTDEILALRRADGRTEARPFRAVRNYAEFVGELSFSTWREMGARGILLVEGVSDARAITTLLRLLRKDMEIVVLPMGGRELIKAGTGREIAELLRLSTEVHVLVDSEREKPNEELSRQRQEFVAECKNLEIDVHVLDRRALENYWPDAAIKRVKGDKATSLDHFSRIKGTKCGWGKSDNGPIASEVKVEELQGTDLFTFLEKL